MPVRLYSRGLSESRFLPFPYEKFADELHSSTEIAAPPLVPPRFSRSATFWDERATVEVKFSTSEIKQTSSFIFYLGNLDERSSSSARPAACFGFYRI